MALDAQVNLVSLRDLMLSQTESRSVSGDSVFFNYSRRKIQVIVSTRSSNESILDLAKVADVIAFVSSANEPIDETGIEIVQMVKAQGMPSSICAIQGLDVLPVKMRNECRKVHTKDFHFLLPHEPRVVAVSNENEAQQLLRFVSELHLTQVRFRENRAYMLADSFQWNPANGALVVSGFLRGCNLSANQLVHVPGVGDFQVNGVKLSNDPYFNNRVIEEEISLPSQELRESLQVLNDPGLWAAEQTWPTDAEIAASNVKQKRVVRVPKGTSTYQAEWLIHEDDSQGEGEGEGEGEDSQEVDEDGDAPMQAEDMEVEEEEQSGIEEEKSEDEWLELGREEAFDEDENMSDREDEFKDETTEQRRARDERNYLQFPDEVDTPRNVPAQERFQKYRGLKSFRSSSWDPKESLPVNYSKIFQFESFQRSKTRAMASRNIGIGVNHPSHITPHTSHLTPHTSRLTHARLMQLCLMQLC